MDESKRDMAARKGENRNTTHDSEPAKYLYNNIQLWHNWAILENASKHTTKNEEEHRSD